MKNQLKRAIELLGWIGVVLVLLAYFLNNFELIDTKNIFYPLMNLAGSVFIILSSADNKDWQPIVLNIVWGLIALAGLVQVFS